MQLSAAYNFKRKCEPTATLLCEYLQKAQPGNTFSFSMFINMGTKWQLRNYKMCDTLKIICGKIHEYKFMKYEQS